MIWIRLDTEKAEILGADDTRRTGNGSSGGRLAGSSGSTTRGKRGRRSAPATTPPERAAPGNGRLPQKARDLWRRRDGGR